MSWDVVIVGGGPAGLAAAIECSRQGLGTVVLERAPSPPDKACGEGLAPRGLLALEALGALRHVPPADRAPFDGIRFTQEDGAGVEAKFRAGPGLGIRRTGLASALTRAASDAGVDLRFGTAATHWRRTFTGIEVETTAGGLAAKLLVLADGLGSKLQRPEAMRAVGAATRYGMRRHFRLRPWSRFVEVHWAEGLEAYVTPAGPDRVGLAFLWDKRRGPRQPSFEGLLTSFPRLRERLGSAPFDSTVRGAGPVGRRARAVVDDRVVLLGDAAGSVDPITGEGLSLAFECAEVLGSVVRGAIATGARAEAFAPYARAFESTFGRATWFARGLLVLSRHPRLRRAVIRRLQAHPRVFEELLHLASEPRVSPERRDSREPRVQRSGASGSSGTPLPAPARPGAGI